MNLYRLFEAAMWQVAGLLAAVLIGMELAHLVTGAMR